MSTSGLKNRVRNSGSDSDWRGNSPGAGPPIPADGLSSFVDSVRSGAAAEPIAGVPASREAPTVAAPSVPAVVAELLEGPHSADFLALASWYTEMTLTAGLDVAVETELGDVVFKVLEWSESPGFLKLVVDRRTMPFQPRLMVDMRLRRNDGALFDVTCYTPLVPLLGTLPYAEMLFIINETNPMEKNARIETGRTPSAVSGVPSTGIDNEEPVADQEKAASLRTPLSVPRVDFDVSRED